MAIKIITENQKDFMPLLLLADEYEDVIDAYLNRGTLFALDDGGFKGVCVVTDEGGGVFEIQNIAVDEACQRKGFGRAIMDYVCGYYKGQAEKMIVGTGDSPVMTAFYENCGFVFSHRIKDGDSRK